MHPNTIFRAASDDLNLTFARNTAFGTLGVNGAAGPVFAHVPFLLNEDGSVADLHLVRSNPIARMLDAPLPAVIAVMGPNGYISPDWYGVDDMVPTWNYIAVHLRGRLEMRPHDEMRDLLTRQSAAHEARIEGKAPWVLDKLTDQQIDKLLRMIVPVRLQIEAVEGTWKLGQNRTDDARRAAAAELHAGFGQELAHLAAFMAEPPA